MVEGTLFSMCQVLSGARVVSADIITKHFLFKVICRRLAHFVFIFIFVTILLIDDVEFIKFLARAIVIKRNELIWIYSVQACSHTQIFMILNFNFILFCYLLTFNPVQLMLGHCDFLARISLWPNSFFFYCFWRKSVNLW